MLNIFTDNWDNPPILNEDESVYRIYTSNHNDVLYAITDLTGDELDDEVRFALRHTFGDAVKLVDLEDVSCIIYEEAEAKENARKDADESWDGEGYYLIGWSDGGMDWTNNGPVWFDRKDDLADELEAAYADNTDTHLPYAEKVVVFGNYDDGGFDAMFGKFKEDYDIEGVIEAIDEATRPTADGKNRYWVGLTTPEEGQEELNKILEENLKK